jgi:SPP1 family predicted phage head-tail adaptor
MNPGDLSQRITLQRYAETADGIGGAVAAWSNLATDPSVWAAVKAKGGRESQIEGRTAATFVVVFTIYNRTDLTEMDRILWDGVAYNIRGILRRGGATLMLEIEAERGVAQ